VTVAGVNEYVQGVSSFVKSRCPIEYCKHILIVGDDFVVPMYRRVDVKNKGVSYIDVFDNKYLATFLTDYKFINLTNVGVSDSDTFFGEVEPIAIVTPDNMSEEMETEVISLKNILRQKHGTPYFYDITSSMVDCRPGISSALYGKTAILIGNSQNNNAITCLAWQINPSESIIVKPNDWGVDPVAGQNQLVIIYANSEMPIKFVSKMIENDMFNETDFDTLQFVDTKLDQCSFVGLVPFYIDTVGDICQGTRDCGHFAGGVLSSDLDVGAGGWCVLDAVAVALPVGAKHLHIIEKLKNLGTNGLMFLGRGLEGVEFLGELWLKSESKMDTVIVLIGKYGNEVGNFFLHKGSKITDVIASKYDNVDDLIRNLSPDAKRVFEDSIAHQENLSDTVAKGREALAYANLEEKVGAKIVKTEQNAGTGIDFIIDAAGENTAVSVKTIEPTTIAENNIATRLIDGANKLAESQSKTNKNVIYVQAFESNYAVTESAIKSILAGEYGETVLKNSDEIKIVISKIPDYLGGV